MDVVDGVAQRIRLAVATGLAMAVTGCGPTVVLPDGDTGGAGGDAADGHDTTSSASASSTAGDDGVDGGQPSATAVGSDGVDDDDDGADDGPKYDISVPPPPPTIPPDRQCFDDPPPMAECPVVLGQGQVLGYRCIPQQVQFSCEGISSEDVFEEAQSCLGCLGFVDTVKCGPVGSGIDTCCSWIVYSPGQSCPGRPFTVAGVARIPEVARRSDWSANVHPPTGHLDDETRQTLARAWAIEGCFEAASIASFSRFVLELLATAAPAQLVADAQRALFEETGHARAFFGLASAYGGYDVGPAALEVADALQQSSDLGAIAESLAREGCIGETVSALQLQVAADRVQDPSLRVLLQGIAEEELRHAELAWRAMGWLLRLGDDTVRQRLARTFATAQDFVPRSTTASDGLPASTLRECGRLGREERLALAEQALADLVAPAAAELLAPWSVSAGDAALAS